jgi:transcriptional regulator with XRE-family HTH domain
LRRSPSGTQPLTFLPTLSENGRERFGFAVKARREELGLTQEDLADRAGIRRTYFSEIERGSRNVALVNIESLAAGLSLAMSELFQRVERP